ncbi:MAG: hypothetical protein WD926_01070 [Patescibacteria group bacterium]
MRKRIVFIVVLAAATGMAGVVAAGRLSERPAGGVAAEPEISANPSGKVRPGQRQAPANPEQGYGHLEGPVTYPGEGIPGDIRVCAVNLATSRETCTGDILRHRRFRDSRGYRLSVPPGNYQVYAVAPSFDPGYQAFYSAFVVCGYRAGCTDHSPITVSVKAGQTRTGVEPGDFYD